MPLPTWLHLHYRTGQGTSKAGSRKYPPEFTERRGQPERQQPGTPPLTSIHFSEHESAPTTDSQTETPHTSCRSEILSRLHTTQTTEQRTPVISERMKISLQHELEPVDSSKDPPDFSDQVETEIPQHIPHGCFLVYRGRLDGSSIAIKVLERANLRTMRRRTQREQSMWPVLNAPNILQFASGHYLLQSYPAIISPWLSHGDAAKYLAKSEDSTTKKQRTDLGKDLIPGVADPDACNAILTHADLKPGDVLIDRTKHPIAGALHGHSDCVRSVAFSPDGHQVVSGTCDQTIRVWDAVTGDSGIYKKLRTDEQDQDTTGAFEHLQDIYHTYHTSRHLAETEPRQEALGLPKDRHEEFHPDTGSFHEHSDWVRSVAFSPDGRQIISGSCDQTIRLWDAVTGHPLPYRKPGPDELNQDTLAFSCSTDGHRVVSGSCHQSIRLWDAVTGHPLAYRKPGPDELDQDNTGAFSYSPDIYYTSGYLAGAEPRQEALKLPKDPYEFHPDTIATSNHMMCACVKLGGLKDVVEPQKVLKLRKEVAGVGHILAVAAYANLSGTHRPLMYYAVQELEAEAMTQRYIEADKLQEVLNFLKVILGMEHPDTIAALAGLSLAYYVLGHYAEAEELRVQALRLQKGILGGHHPDTIVASYNLADTCRPLKETEALQYETVKQTEGPFENECYTMTTMMLIMTGVYESLKLLSEALTLLDSAGPKRNSMTTASHPVGTQPFLDPELVLSRNDARLITTNNDHAVGCFCAKCILCSNSYTERKVVLQQPETNPPGDPDSPHLNGQVVIPDYRMPKFGRASLVYRGMWCGKQVAVKVLKARKCAERATNWETKMRREITLATTIWAALEHPNILPLSGYSDDFGDFGALILPWCEQGNAQQYLAARDLAWNERVRLTQGVCEGLLYLHRASIVHGDLKPMNILIDQAGVCRICDFGLSTLVHQQELGDLTKTTVRDGPERYLAPEIFASVDSHPAILTSEGDIYSLGCIILEFIEGVYPFQRLATNRQVIDAILGGLPPASRCESNHNLPTMTDTLWNLLDACWGEPSSRPNVATVVKCVASLATVEGAQCLTPLACTGLRCRSAHSWTALTCDMKGATTKDNLPRSLGAPGQAGGNHGKWRRWKWSGRKKGKSMGRNHI